MDFRFFETGKLGGNWSQEFAIVRANTVYLRVVGDGTHYRVMTATAGEEEAGFQICAAKELLWKAATLLARDHGCEESFHNDKQGRVYVQIFKASQPEGDPDESFTASFIDLIKGFFTRFDALETNNAPKP